MADPLRIEAGDLEADAILEAIEEGRHVVVTTTTLGDEHEVTLRYDGSVYYCDTPTRLHRHESAREMRTCIRNMGYGTAPVGDDT
ncbi:hypothetical protein [Natronococcus jeotgali]|uniref:DUF8001 domain-containing protein n=1 Tax=Natronococcus jeotgali DSM 18795 TaxID=1227498 RepID=L9XRR4_9EURY|nr:hypothetical protein [Natronococcus jeotgali]ELY64096.1 hypothetical protein C492_06232 [Natronococcus jeotgali DSM 18795]